MTRVTVSLGPTRVTPADLIVPELIDDLDVLSESDRCSCSAGDDNPY